MPGFGWRRSRWADMAAYKAFISYNHGAEEGFAAPFQEALEKLAKPWRKRRGRRVMLDEKAMSAGSSLSDTIEAKLASSEWLVMLASPQAADSPWCNDELEYWDEHKSMDKVIIALTGGEIVIDAEAEQIDWEATTALSDTFRGLVGEDAVPLYEDLRSFKGDPDHLSLRNKDFRDEIAKIVGTLEGKDPGELASEDQRQYRRGVLVRRAFQVGLAVLTIIAGGLAIFARNRQVAAEDQARLANSRAAASEAVAEVVTEPDQAALFALESLRIEPTLEARLALLSILSTPSNFVQRVSLEGDPTLLDAAWSPDGSSVAVIGADGVVRVWPVDAASGRPDGDPVSIEPAPGAWKIAFSADGAALRTMADSGVVETWDPVDGTRLDEITVDPVALALSRHGDFVVTFDFAFMVLWSVDGSIVDQVELEEPLPEEEEVVAVSSDGRGVAWAGARGGVWRWIVGSDPQYLLDTDDLINAIQFVPESEALVVALSDGGIHYLPSEADPEFFDPEADFEPDPGSEALDISIILRADQMPLVATAHLDGTVQVWELDTTFGLAFADPSRLLGHRDEATAIALSPNGERVMSAGFDGDVIWWDRFPNTRIGSALAQHGDDVLGVAFLDDGSRLVSVDAQGLAAFWDVTETGDASLAEEVEIFPIDDDEATALAIARDGSGFAVGTLSGAIVLIDAAGAERGRWQAHEVPVAGLVFNPDDSAEPALLSIDDSGRLHSWDRSDLASPGSAEPDLISETADHVPGFAPDGSQIAWTDDDGLHLWTAETDVATVLLEPPDLVTTVEFSGDGRLLAWAEANRRIGLWDLEDEEELGEDLTGHSEFISDMEFLERDGQSVALISVSYDWSIRMWDVSEQRLLGVLGWHANDVNSLAVNPNGTLIATAGDDDVVWLWEADEEKWVELACDLAGRNMAEPEWSRFNLEQPYLRHCAAFPNGEGVGEPEAKVAEFDLDRDAG